MQNQLVWIYNKTTKEDTKMNDNNWITQQKENKNIKNSIKTWIKELTTTKQMGLPDKSNITRS